MKATLWTSKLFKQIGVLWKILCSGLTICIFYSAAGIHCSHP